MSLVFAVDLSYRKPGQLIYAARLAKHHPVLHVQLPNFSE